MMDVSECRACVRLNTYREEVKREFPDYYCKPVPACGEASSRILIVGLAPGKHGANATGIPFTGDASGQLLFQALAKFDLAEVSVSADNAWITQLRDCRITNAVKCLPPQNKPLNAEIHQCNDFLKQEVAELGKQGIILSLGAIAHKAILRALNLKPNEHPFAHGAETSLSSGQILISSYHCSRYNVQTRRLTPAMFFAVFERIRRLLDND